MENDDELQLPQPGFILKHYIPLEWWDYVKTYLRDRIERDSQERAFPADTYQDVLDLMNAKDGGGDDGN